MFEDIRKFNTMYGFPCPTKPTLPADLPLQIMNFTKILREELDEGYALIENFHKGADPLDTLTEVADLLGDLIVYCASEAVKYGLPLEQVLKAIMESNFSKLGADGKPIKDERNKLLKGPGYWKPEPKIAELLKARM